MTQINPPTVYFGIYGARATLKSQTLSLRHKHIARYIAVTMAVRTHLLRSEYTRRSSRRSVAASAIDRRDDRLV